MGSDVEVTASDREKAAQLSGCVLDDHPGAPFCASHDEDGNPPWHRCRWVPIAQALADERAKARAPFLALAEEYDRHAGLMQAEIDSGGPLDVIMRSQAFRDAAETIRQAAEDAPEVSET